MIGLVKSTKHSVFDMAIVPYYECLDTHLFFYSHHCEDTKWYNFKFRVKTRRYNFQLVRSYGYLRHQLIAPTILFSETVYFAESAGPTDE